MAKKNENVLTVEFLAELYNAAITNTQICSVVCRYMEDKFLPDQQYQMLNSALKSYFNDYKAAPNYGIISQRLASSRAVSELLEEIKEVASGTDIDAIRDSFEEYLKLVQFKKILKEVNKKYDEGMRLDAMSSLVQQVNELQQFTLKSDEFIEIATTYEERLRENKSQQENTIRKSVNSFFIDGLDVINKGRNLRGQLSIYMSLSGVGKSHVARYTSYCAAYIAGLNVLHISLEGSAEETTNAFSAMLTKTTTYDFERGNINEHTLQNLRNRMEMFQGTLRVKAYTRFGMEVSTADLNNEIEKYKNKYGVTPDVLVVDSLDLLTDCSSMAWNEKSLRHKRVKVAQELKNLAMCYDLWCVSTYQSAHLDPEWIANEKNYITSFNSSECKALSRPTSHFITLNRSPRENREGLMRIYVDKFRFADRGEPFRICTDYEHEMFYDREGTLNLPANSDD